MSTILQAQRDRQTEIYLCIEKFISKYDTRINLNTFIINKLNLLD